MVAAHLVLAVFLLLCCTDLDERLSHPPEVPCPTDQDMHPLCWTPGADGVLAVGVDDGSGLLVGAVSHLLPRQTVLVQHPRQRSFHPKERLDHLPLLFSSPLAPHPCPFLLLLAQSGCKLSSEQISCSRRGESFLGCTHWRGAPGRRSKPSSHGPRTWRRRDRWHSV